jgi:hypothetical protein
MSPSLLGPGLLDPGLLDQAGSPQGRMPPEYRLLIPMTHQQISNPSGGGVEKGGIAGN